MITGLIAAPLAAMDADGRLDTAVVTTYADFLKANGVSGVFVNGSTGEGMSLAMTERKAIAEAWIGEKSDDFKVIIHTGHTSLQESMELAAHAEACGADATGSIAPIYYKVKTVEHLATVMARVAGAAPSLPFYFYHIPSLTGVNFPMYDFLKVAGPKIPNLMGIKYTHENFMDFERCRLLEDGKYNILHGGDETLIMALVLGAKGAVGSTYNVLAPLYNQLIHAFEDGNLEEACRLQRLSMDFIAVLIEDGCFYSALKTIMETFGLDLGPVREPVPTLDGDKKEALLEKLKQLGFFDYSCKAIRR